MSILFVLLCATSAICIVASALYLGHDTKNRTTGILLSVGLAFAVPALCLAGLLLEAPALSQVANSPAVAVDTFAAQHSNPSVGEETLNFAQAHKAEAEAELTEKTTEIVGRGWDVLGAGFTFDFVTHNLGTIVYPLLCLVVLSVMFGGWTTWNLTRRRSE